MIKHKDIPKDIPKLIIVYGGTGQCLQVKPMIEYYGSRILAIIDDTKDLKSPFNNIPIFQGYDNFIKNGNWRFDKIGFCIAIGNNPSGAIRLELHNKLKNDGFIPISLAHQTAWIGEDVIIGSGTKIMAKADICARVKIGKQCIISGSVGHECILGNCVEIGPSAMVGGIVEIGDNTWIGINTTILPRLKIGKNVLVGAGSVVTTDILDNITVFGNPARPFFRRD